LQALALVVSPELGLRHIIMIGFPIFDFAIMGGGHGSSHIECI